MNVDNPTVLVVDDDEDSCLMLEVSLADRGFNVVAERSFRGAVEALRREPVDALVCDLTLGDGTALDVIRADGVRRPRVAVVLTGFDSDEDRERSIEAGYDAHLVKPTRVDVLAELITRGLHRPSEIRLATPQAHDARGAQPQRKRR